MSIGEVEKAREIASRFLHLLVMLDKLEIKAAHDLKWQIIQFMLESKHEL